MISVDAIDKQFEKVQKLGFVKDIQLEVLKKDSGILTQLTKQAAVDKEAVVEEIDPRFVYFWTRAVTADVPNGNGDIFPLAELKESHKTFIGRNLHLDHNSDSVRNAVGKVVAAELVKDDENDKDYAVYCLCKVDSVSEPAIASKVKTGTLNSVSMGASVKEAECNICGQKAHSELEYCEHLANLGRIFNGKTAHSINHGISFTELSLVGVPADSTALVNGVFAGLEEGMKKEAKGTVNDPEELGGESMALGEVKDSELSTVLQDVIDSLEWANEDFSEDLGEKQARLAEWKIEWLEKTINVLKQVQKVLGKGITTTESLKVTAAGQAKDVINETSRFIAAIDTFKERAPQPVVRLIQEHLEPMKKQLGDAIINADRYIGEPMSQRTAPAGQFPQAPAGGEKGMEDLNTPAKAPAAPTTPPAAAPAMPKMPASLNTLVRKYSKFTDQTISPELHEEMMEALEQKETESEPIKDLSEITGEPEDFLREQLQKLKYEDISKQDWWIRGITKIQTLGRVIKEALDRTTNKEDKMKVTFVKQAEVADSYWKVEDAKGKVVVQATLQGLFGDKVEQFSKYATSRLCGFHLVKSLERQGKDSSKIIADMTKRAEIYTPLITKIADESSHSKSTTKVPTKTDKDLTEGGTSKIKEKTNTAVDESGHAKAKGKATNDTDSDIVEGETSKVKESTHTNGNESGHAKCQSKVPVKTDEAVTAAAEKGVEKTADVKIASAFDKMPEPITVGKNMTAEKDAKTKEIVIKKGEKEHARFPDAFGDDMTTITQFFTQLYKEEEKDVKGAKPFGGKETPAEEAAEKKVEQQEKKEEKPEEKKEMDISVAEELKTTKEKLAAMEMQKKLDEKISKCKGIVAIMAEKGLLSVDADEVKTELAKDAAMSIVDAKQIVSLRATDKQMKELLAMDDTTLQAFENSVKMLKTATVESGTMKKSVLETPISVQASGSEAVPEHIALAKDLWPKKFGK